MDNINMDSIVSRLSSLEKEIGKAKISIATLQGEKNSIVDRLLKEFMIDNIEDAQKKMDELKVKIAELETDINTKFSKLKATYEW